jgi:hypothetical protein
VGRGLLVYLSWLSQKAVRQRGRAGGQRKRRRCQIGRVHWDKRYKGGLLEARRFCAEGRGCVGEQWRKGRVELLRLLSSWAMWRLSCEALRGGFPCVCFAFFVGGVCLCLARHGLPRHWSSETLASRGMVFRDIGLPRRGLPRRWPYEARS